MVKQVDREVIKARNLNLEDSDPLLLSDVPWVTKDKLVWNQSVKWITSGTGSQNFSMDLNFSASDFDTVDWTSGKINTSWGSSFSINSWNTWNMSSTTYIYLDTNVSKTTLQTTTVSGNSVWENKILVAVASPNSNSNKNAKFQAFGNSAVGAFVTAAEVAADTITANEIASNTITASQISSDTITANEIAANTISANEITFNYADSTSKWWNAIDTDNVNWTNASDVDDGAGRARNALDSATNRYKKRLTSNDLSSASGQSGQRIEIDWSGLRWYNSWGSKTFEITWDEWNAFFQWDIWASTVTWNIWIWTSWIISVDNSSWEYVDTYIDNWTPKIEFQNNNVVVWFLSWEEWYTSTVSWVTFTIDAIKSSSDFICWNDLLIQDDLVVEDEAFVNNRIFSDQIEVLDNSTSRIKLPVWTDLYDT